MDCTAYLARIGYQGSIEPTLSVLRDLQRCHLYSVPFENLDIHLGVPIRLDLGDIYKKIVKQRRGGFCYELNGVYFELLRSLGFNASRVSARVFDREKGFGQEFDHLAIIVHLGKEAYLTDVGFGRFAMHPLQIRLDENQMDDAGTFVITGQSDGCFLVNQVKDDLTEPVYRFDPYTTESMKNLQACASIINPARNHTLPKSGFSLSPRQMVGYHWWIVS